MNGETQGEDGVLTINLSGQLIDRELLSEPGFPELGLQEKARTARLRRGTQLHPTMVSSVVDKQWENTQISYPCFSLAKPIQKSGDKETFWWSLKCQHSKTRNIVQNEGVRIWWSKLRIFNKNFKTSMGKDKFYWKALKNIKINRWIHCVYELEDSILQKCQCFPITS